MSDDARSADAILLDCVSETFEQMAFQEAQAARFYWARVPVLAPVAGALTIRCTGALVHEIAETMWSRARADLTPAQLEDTTAELANTMAGRLLSGLLPPDRTFQLGLPEHGVGFALPCPHTAMVGHFEVAGHLVAVVLDGAELTRLLGSTQRPSGCRTIRPEPGPEAP